MFIKHIIDLNSDDEMKIKCNANLPLLRADFISKLFDMENPSHETVLVIRDLNVIAAELDIPQTAFAKAAIEKAAVNVEVRKNSHLAPL